MKAHEACQIYHTIYITGMQLKMLLKQKLQKKYSKKNKEVQNKLIVGAMHA